MCDPVRVHPAFAGLAALCLFFAAFPLARANEAAAWSALAAGGHTLLLRHAATEPGVGDPAGFRLDDCATQRNLSAEGRLQADAIGKRLASRSVAIGAVLSSRWCRCLDTARLAFGSVEEWPPLDSFFSDREAANARTREVLERAKRWQGPGTLVLVTHQMNIIAAAGESTAMGEGLVIDRAGRVIGRVPAAP